MRKLTLKVTERADGRVCKRVDGRLRIWPDAASARKDLLNLIALREGQAGAVALLQSLPSAAVSIREVFNQFIEDREARMMRGDIKKASFLKYKDAIDSFISAIENWKPHVADALSLSKRECPVSALQPIHFRHAREWQGKGRGACSLDVRVQVVRSAFRWAAETARLIQVIPHYGDDYHKPTTAEKRSDKRAREDEHGEHRFTPAELSKLLKSKNLTGAMKAMVWLGLNSGMYAADCAELRWSDIKKVGRHWIIDTYREKTKIRQKFVLWPETKAAMDEWRPKCPAPKDEYPADLVFVTRHRRPWVLETIRMNEEGQVEGGSTTNSVSLNFNKLRKALKIKRYGVGFGAFRHTHTSASSRHPDMNARMVVRGHQIHGIESHYDYQNIDVLKAVTDVVYKSLIKPAISNTRVAKS